MGRLINTTSMTVDGVIDVSDFWIHPRIQGAGNRPYEAATVPVRLLEARQFDSGVTLLRYQPMTGPA